MAQRAGRVTCPRCGANNFDTVASCWKCGAALPTGAASGTAVAPPLPTSAGPAPASSNVSAVRPDTVSPASRVNPLYSGGYADSAAHTPVLPSGDVGMARRAAITLAITLPWLGLPVGWIFMMMEDSRRQAMGRFCARWSLVALVFHTLLMFALAQSLIPTLNAAVRMAQSMGQRQGSSPSPSMPEVP